jgi:hypothetical protein
VQRYLSQLGALEVKLPAVKDGILDEIDAMDLDVGLALTQRQHLARYVRNELLAWEVKATDALRDAEELFIPAGSQSADTRDDAIFGKSLSF